MGAVVVRVVSWLAWHGIVRALLFWGIVGAVMAVLAPIAPKSNYVKLWDGMLAVTEGSFGHLSTPDFAFALASAIGQLALALAVAFFVCHVLLIGWTLGAARRTVERRRSQRDFAADFDRVRHRLEGNGLIGPAWHEFAKTVTPRDGVVHNTARPQAFINSQNARDRLFGLKMMPSIPGFFVGLGLLLTFIGLVLALDKASGTTTAASAADMSKSLTDLLNAATFKFSTSIAGLGASLVLSLLFRIYQILIDGMFHDFCQSLERRLSFQSAQQIAMETRDILAEQRDQLKEINSDRFFSRLGDSITPSFQTALGPMAEALTAALQETRTSSQTGVSDMLQQFLEQLRGGAGVEMSKTAETLHGVQAALADTRAAMAGTGADMAQRLGDVTDRLIRAIEEAGRAAAALSQVSADVREASTPLLEHGTRVADAATTMAAAIDRSVAALTTAEQATAKVAAAVTSHFDMIGATWTGYEERFKAVDTDLTRAAALFGEHVAAQQDGIGTFVRGVDESNAKILGELARAVAQVNESVDTLQETLEDFLARLPTATAPLAEVS